MGKNSASSASAGMVWTRLANPSVARATAGERLAQIASGSATAMPSAIAAAESRTCAASLSPRPSRAAPISLTVRAPPAGRPARGERRRGPARSAASAVKQRLRVSSATIDPPSITSTRSASSSASAMSCVTMTVVRPRSPCSARTRSPSASRVIGSSAPKGSSISSKCGSLARARATPTRWR